MHFSQRSCGEKLMTVADPHSFSSNFPLPLSFSNQTAEACTSLRYFLHPFCSRLRNSEQGGREQQVLRVNGADKRLLYYDLICTKINSEVQISVPVSLHDTC